MDFDEAPQPTTPGSALDPEGRSGPRWPHLTLLVGPLPGRMFRFVEPETSLGRAGDCDIHFVAAGVSRLHATLRRLDNGDVELVDDASTNGTYVNGVRTPREVLHDGDKIQLGPDVVLRYNLQDAIDEAFQRRQFEAMTRDGLTGCFNRMYFDEELFREMSYAQRSGGSISIAMIDLDHYKKINDTHGHAAGDQVLAGVGRVLVDMLRQYDLVARVGGEEFALLMRNADLATGRLVAERVRERIARLVVAIGGGKQLNVTASVGVASLSEDRKSDVTLLMRTADSRLYAAKRRGRNCTVSAGVVVGEGQAPTHPIRDDPALEAARKRLRMTVPMQLPERPPKA